MYYLSVLSTFKNETMNLKIWLEHYIWQGVEHFYLIDNGSTDNPLEILQEYIDKNIVSYFYLPEKHNQVKNYRKIFDEEKLKETTEWLIVCDLDEFFYGVDNKLITKIKSLNNFFDYILCNWEMFGSDGLIEQPFDIRTSITHCDKKLWKETKYIFKPKKIKNSSCICIHYLLNHDIPKSRTRIANKLIKLNHYPIQSLEFFKKTKMNRGDASNKKTDNIRDMTYFEKYDFRNINNEILKNLVLNYNSNY
jgi:glycosyltransferase involved in cell wall biosynthesis